MQKKILHFDLADGNVNFDLSFYESRLKSFGQSYNTRVQLPYAIRNVSSLTLQNVEFPLLGYNIRKENGSNRMRIRSSIRSRRFTLDFTIPEGNHTTINTLILDINTAITSAMSLQATSTFSAVITLMINPSTGRLMFKNNADTASGNNSDFVFLDNSPLLKMLGFNLDISTRSSDGFAYLQMSNMFQLNLDTYYNMTITNIGAEPTNDYRPCLFKIPINGRFGDTIFLTDMKQTVYLENETISYLNVIITDRNGFNVYSNGSTMSFSLLLEFSG